MSNKLSLAVSSHFRFGSTGILVYWYTVKPAQVQLQSGAERQTSLYFSYWPQFVLYLIEIADITGLVQSTRGQVEVRDIRCRTNEVWRSVRLLILINIWLKKKTKKTRKKYKKRIPILRSSLGLGLHQIKTNSLTHTVLN